MCKYCEKILATGRKVKEVIDVELMENLPIMRVDNFFEKPIENNSDNPKQYIRKYGSRYSLITEFPDDNGTVLSLCISSCPVCGRKLN